MEVQNGEETFPSYTIAKRQREALISGDLTPETTFLSMLMHGFSGCLINVWLVEAKAGWAVWRDASDTSSPCVPLEGGGMGRLV